MPRIIITGGSGLIGSALANEIGGAGYEIVVLSRNPARVRGLPNEVRVVLWDGKSANGWGVLVDGETAIVNLAGQTIARPPWTEGYKRAIRESRVNAGRAVVAAVKSATAKPRVVIQSSAVGFYGPHGDDFVTEETPPGDDFLSKVCIEWEAASAEVEQFGVRRAIIRTGLVLSNQGGVLPLIVLPFRFFVGGPIGDGKQFYPWIHIADHVKAIRFLIENENARNAFNLTAPTPITNADFARFVGRAMNRPAIFLTPAFALRLALGEMADLLLLSGQRAVPRRIQELGFEFQFKDAEKTLRDLL